MGKRVKGRGEKTERREMGRGEIGRGEERVG